MFTIGNYSIRDFIMAMVGESYLLGCPRLSMLAGIIHIIPTDTPISAFTITGTRLLPQDQLQDLQGEGEGKSKGGFLITTKIIK